MNILLVCAGGFSTSLVVTKMKDALIDDQKDWVIEAHPMENLEYLIDTFDVVLLGPQVAHKLKGTKKQFASSGKAFGVIPSVDYAMGNGKKILDLAIKMKGEN